MSHRPKSLFDALDQASATASLLARVRASTQAARILAHAATIPGLDPLTPGMCELRDRVLWLRAPSSALAAKLRQYLPTLLVAMQRQGLDVNEIKIKIQPKHSLTALGLPNEAPLETAKQPTQPLPRTAIAKESVGKLVLTLPDSPLRRAVEELSQQLGRDSGR